MTDETWVALCLEDSRIEFFYRADCLSAADIRKVTRKMRGGGSFRWRTVEPFEVGEAKLIPHQVVEGVQIYRRGSL